MARRQLHKLSAKEAETISTPGYHSDGGGLYLAVGTGGARSWLFIYKERGTGKRKELGLGSAARKGGVSLGDARKRAEGFRGLLHEGKDPAAIRKAGANAGITFGEYADAFLESIKAGFKGRNTHRDWKRELEVHAKSLRGKALADITTNDVLAVISPLWLTTNRTARETRSRIERVLDAADSNGLRSGRNPAEWKALKPLLPKAKKSKRHHKAAPYKDVPAIVAALRTKHDGADTAVNRAAEFIILTAVRTGEARFMRAREINFKDALWTVPPERMKTEDHPEGKPHEVPLCARAVAILRAVMPKDLEPDAYVFAGRGSRDHKKPLGPNAVLHALQKVYPAMTAHGCRSSFRDWAGDETHFPREVAEMALAHKVGDEVERAYRRGTALKKRRELMEAWGRYVEGESNVLKLAAAG
ncbi:site-specific integrase [Bradyrhizobium sp. 153]|uniref:tyrosine-type recombinase/integrase n=1 Tax=Bradyrhizobium sp. 153 TaxID=2782627 RepID=UPI001FFBF02A|nr:site-specific integrase [Bradyrhizobium sp. 153]MCK1668685.1 integrase arm-type DNA-binding domain-containing protein [Bradyrhizobium sp. 153]